MEMRNVSAQEEYSNPFARHGKQFNLPPINELIKNSETTADELCLSKIFEAHVDRTPFAPAIITKHKTLNYLELDYEANRMARMLRQKNIGQNSLVGIYFNRSEKPIIALLGVLKSGAAYVPLDPSYPKDRIKYILESANISVLITEQELKTSIDIDYQENIITLDDNYSELIPYSVGRLSEESIGPTPKDLSYILFTSGTTGRPKGIMTEHRNVSRFIKSFNKATKIDSNDRIYQGFSLGFDGSVEEIWMAFSNGASLIIGNQNMSRLGEETAQFMNDNNVTVFSTVPTFLGLIKIDLKSVKLLIVSGEPCPPALVDIWSSNNRRMLNVYGPTETTVNTTVKECFPGEKVTIGTPLDGYETYVLDKELNPVHTGESGELYIGGIGLARGYFKNPELTSKTFITNPFDINGNSPRLYKTGDMVKEENGELHFIHRIDTQIKIRGYRVELSEIEAVIKSSPFVDMAIVNIYKHNGLDKLAAYLVLSIPTKNFKSNELLKLLKEKLPSYMIPSFMDILDELPMLASGKMDRKQLPTPVTPLVDTEREIILPENSCEENLLTTWQNIFLNNTISTEDNFFTDLGGDSLGAVEMVSELRENFEYKISIRDAYNHLTIKELAQHIILNEQTSDKSRVQSSTTKIPSAKEVFKNTKRVTHYTCIALQAISIGLLYGTAFIPLIISVWTIYGFINNIISLQVALTIITTLIIMTYPTTLLMSIAIKRIVIGKFKPGKYPLWSIYYFRWWLIDRIQSMTFLKGITGTPLMSLYYRLMGAKVGSNTIIDTAECSIFDLVTIGSNTAIGSDTQILGYRIENGMLIIGELQIGNKCYIGNHSAVGLNSKMEDNSCLDNLSLLPDNTTIPKSESWSGSPAKPQNINLDAFEKEDTSKKYPILIGTMHLLGLYFVGLIFTLITLPMIAIIAGGFYLNGFSGAFIAALFIALFGVVIFCLMVAGVKALLMKKTRPGVYSTQSLYYVRKWTVDLFLTSSSAAVHTLYTTIYLPIWLRMLGTKIGRRAEISTITSMNPDLTTIGDESFFADGSVIGGRQLYRGQVQYAENIIGDRTFIGNNAMLSPGESLGNDCLLGVLSVPPKIKGNIIPDKTEWLGSPSFKLPHRNKVTHFDASETFKPTLKLYIFRYIIDALRIFVPNLIILFGAILYVTYLINAFQYLPFWLTAVLAPIVGIISSLSAVMSVIILKKILMGTFKPEVRPLWSVYVWLNELVNGAYETIGAPLLAPMMGTPFYNIFLRLMGCKIGKHCYIGTSLFSEFDLVEIGDYCALNSGVVIQNHLFEDRVMKSSYVKIKNECSIGNLSIVLYDSVLEERTNIAPLSLVMKGDSLSSNKKWIGIPISKWE